MGEKWSWVWGILLSVIITFFSFPPHPLGALMPMALIPLFWAAHTAKNWRRAFLRVWLYCIVGNFAICFWVGYTLEEFSSLPPWISYSCVILLSLFEQSSMAVTLAIRKWAWDRFGKLPPLFTPCLWVALDAAWPKFFPNTLGNALYSLPFLAQGADLIGVWGLTFFLVCANELFTSFIHHQDTRPMRIANVSFLLFFLIYSSARYVHVSDFKKHPEKILRVSIIQPNVTTQMKNKAQGEDFSEKARMLRQLLQMSTSALSSKPDLIFWPETAFPAYFHSDLGPEILPLTEQVDEFAIRHQVPILLGAPDFRNFRSYNGLHLVQPNGERVEVSRYQKHILLPIGERIPFSGIFPMLNRLPLPGKRFTAGPGPQSLGPIKEDIRLGALICYEGLFPAYVRQVAKGNALLVNATNDAWYGPGMEPHLHLQLTAMRSIELRKPLVRATNTGISALIDIDGRILQPTELFAPAILNLEVPVYPEMSSPFQVFGVIPILLGFLWCCLGLMRYHKKEKHLKIARIGVTS